MSGSLSKTWPRRLAAAVAIVFGGLTIVSGGSVLFGGAAVEAAAGQVVPFVLWFNFLSGFVYVLAGIGLALGRAWALPLSVALAVAIAVVFALFGLHVARGGGFEMRTAGAMVLRLVVWVAIAVTALRASRAAPSTT